MIRLLTCEKGLQARRRLRMAYRVASGLWIACVAAWAAWLAVSAYL